MEAPKCKICGERHYGACQRFARELRSSEAQWPKDILEKAASVPPTTINRLPKFDRNAYQRDLMRKRRAAAKMQ